MRFRLVGPPENAWRAFQFELEMALKGDNAGTYDRMSPRFENESQRAVQLLRLLLQQNNGRLVLFLDSLKSLQDPDNLALKDLQVAAWLQAAQSLPGVVLLVTSRWQIPGWPGEHLALECASYGDLFQMAQRLALGGNLPKAFLEEPSRLAMCMPCWEATAVGWSFLRQPCATSRGTVRKTHSWRAWNMPRPRCRSIWPCRDISAPAGECAALLSRLTVYPQPVPWKAS